MKIEKIFGTFAISIFALSSLMSNKTITKDNNLFTLLKEECAELNITVDDSSLSVGNLIIGPDKVFGKIVDFESNYGEGYGLFAFNGDEIDLFELNLKGSSPKRDEGSTLWYKNFGQLEILGKEAETRSLESDPFDKPSEIRHALVDVSERVKKECVLPNYNSYYQGSSLAAKANAKYDSANKKDFKNYCAPVAGCVMLDYWNYKLNNKLLNLPSSYLTNGHVKEEYMCNYFEHFYDIMGTQNWGLGGLPGTHPFNAITAFRDFIEELGYTCDLWQLYDVQGYEAVFEDDYLMFVTSIDYGFVKNELNFSSSKLEFDYKFFPGLASAHAYVAYGSTDFVDEKTLDVNQEFLHIADGRSKTKSQSYRYNYITPATPDFKYKLKIYK